MQAGIEGFFLGDRAHRVAFVIVTRIDQGLVGQSQQLVKQRVILRLGIAALKIGPAGATDQQCIAGKDPVVAKETVGIVGVAGCVERREVDALDFDLIAVADPHRDDVDARLRAHDRDAAGAVAQCAQAGNVVGMDMGVEGLDQLQIEFADELKITVDAVQHRVDDQRFAANPAGQ